MTRDHAGLHRYLEARMPMPFAWGRTGNDCVSFAAGAVLAQGLPDPLDGLPDWACEDEAWAAIDAAGGIDAAISARLRPISPALAQRGDIGAIEAGNGLILVVVEGDAVAGPGPRGMRRLPRRAMVKAWCAAGVSA